jgi:hypothetical protein
MRWLRRRRPRDLVCAGVRMRKLILLGVMAAAALPACAVRHLTVAQLEKTLATSVEKHRTDSDMVREFGDFVLTERLSDASRSRICENLHLGPRTTLALQLLADESAPLDPPAAELPTAAPPDAAASERMLQAAGVYVAKTLPRLPDFLATRTTFRFDDTPQVLQANEWPVSAGLHLVNNSSREVTFRDDHEAPAAESSNVSSSSAKQAQERGLHSWGEFGEMLALIFIDTEKGKLAFHHWEQTPGGLVAVYRYNVPKSASHYSVDYCCLGDEVRASTHRGYGIAPRRVPSLAGDGQIVIGTPFHKIPAYHGSLFIDPDSGVVRRITLEADMDDSPVSRVATVIDYGPVVIGDRKFVCPLRSLNLYLGPAESGLLANEAPSAIPPPLQPKGTLYLNETSFTNYHRLGSEIRILAGTETQPTSKQ